MKMIDKEYEGFNYSGDKWFSLQSKLAAYRKETEAQMQAEMNTEVHIFIESKSVWAGMKHICNQQCFRRYKCFMFYAWLICDHLLVNIVSFAS